MKTQQGPKKINLLNTGLILLSLVLAILFPFRLFLLGYAILGPLHYLTEINWLNEKCYFDKQLPWLPIGLTVIAFVAYPKLVQFAGLLEQPIIGPLAYWMDGFSNGLIFLSLWMAFSSALIKSLKWLLLSLAFGCGLAFLLNGLKGYTLFIALFIPTLIHVYVFTIFFMLYGALKANSAIGLINVALVILVAVGIALIGVDHKLYDLSDLVKNTVVQNGFHVTGIELGKLFGAADGSQYLFYGDWELKAQRFIAFAYIYHYLNWFSKTSVIGWGKSLNLKRTLAIFAIWLSFVVLFAIDYRLGFVSVIGLSFLHVILEFPLNAFSIKEIGKLTYELLKG